MVSRAEARARLPPGLGWCNHATDLEVPVGHVRLVQVDEGLKGLLKHEKYFIPSKLTLPVLVPERVGTEILHDEDSAEVRFLKSIDIADNSRLRGRLIVSSCCRKTDKTGGKRKRGA